jgi:hypothetical protein
MHASPVATTGNRPSLGNQQELVGSPGNSSRLPSCLTLR